MRFSTLAIGYGGTISDPHASAHPLIAQRPVDPRAATTLRELHMEGLRLLLASNARADQDRALALRLAGIEGLFTALVLSHQIGVGKPHAAFYHAVLIACRVPAGQVLWVGSNITNDVIGPLQHGFGAAVLISRPYAATTPPPNLLAMSHIADLPNLLRTWQ